ncbi:MAG: murein L,D-transpeptidase, partial [Blastochloris sp.]|nr:murein L,D-transpeptidase [Blastochloris sp.]
MNRPLPARLLAAVLALGVAASVAGCVSNEVASRLPSRAQQPLKRETLALLDEKGMSKSSPIVVRLFKRESELEIWKPNREGRYELFKTYPICRWSGELGPKIKEGDRQAPEGFYAVVPGLMNPASSYYLAFNTGFPNAFDRAHGRTGGDVMVHGDCSSRGCFAMTDEQIAEIYALGRESFAGGQRSFQVQAYPFRMTPENLAKHRNNPNMAFWRMLKEGNDQFLVSRRALKVDVCEKKYVFNATPVDGGRFDPTGPCPAFDVPQDIAAATEQKRAADDAKVAALIQEGITPAPVKTGTDGGMHPVFLAAVKGIGDQSSSDVIRTEPYRLPGTIPAHAVPPREPIASPRLKRSRPGRNRPSRRRPRSRPLQAALRPARGSAACSAAVSRRPRPRL